MESNVDATDGETVILNCIDPNASSLHEDNEEIVISTVEVSQWDLSSLAHRPIIKIKANRQRLVQQSSYFHGLLCGSFSESCFDSISIHWDMESLLSMLRFLFGCSLDLTSENFLPLYEVRIPIANIFSSLKVSTISFIC
nr:PREDICTED: BTB/POZ domain-containing protein FBL11-like [Nicotiana sylvestris]